MTTQSHTYKQDDALKVPSLPADLDPEPIPRRPLLGVLILATPFAVFGYYALWKWIASW